MWIPIIVMLQMLSGTLESQYDLPDTVEDIEINIERDADRRNMNFDIRNQNEPMSGQSENRRSETPYMEDEKDSNLKQKISTLVEQTMHDTQRKIDSIKHLQNKHRKEAPYRAGFVLSMIKKAREVLNELFNVAVKHRDQWKALEQLKIFELVVHTNVDTTHLVRELVEIHIQHMNSTKNTVLL